jgi:glycosyltransferase involved in cell wall biosynthesis
VTGPEPTPPIRSVLVVAWRDLDHPDAGGSEIHLHEILRRWAAAGLDVTLLTGGVPGAPRRVARDGYVVERAGGPVGGLLAMPWRARRRRRSSGADATVEVWHGVNFGGPLWIRGPRVAIAHHVHRPEFGYVLPRPVAWLARHQEGTVSPRLYRGTPLVTLSEPARVAFAGLGFDPAAITVVPPGVDRRFSPGAGDARSATPRIVTVARLWPQKRVDRLIEVVARLRAGRPDAELVVVGDGPCRPALEAQVAARGLGGAVRFTGTVDDAALVELYRSAWVLASASFGEGWGMTITEAAACATPAVVITNTGHRQAVVDGVTGVLAGDEDGLVAALDRVLGDPGLRRRLGDAAAERARGLDWDRAATAVLDVLVADAHRRARARRRGDRSPVEARMPGIPVDT